MSFAVRERFTWRLRTRSIALGERTVVMGIVNVTPDSFSDGGRFAATEAAVRRALELLEERAEIVDLGGESTRPGAVPVTTEEEQARILPVLVRLLEVRPDAVVSVDTYHARTAERAVQLGAEIVNDVSGLQWDAAMAEVLARLRPGVVLMHTRGRPQEWAGLPGLGRGEMLPLVIEGLGRSVAMAHAAGIEDQTMVLDPGFGFGKRGAENFEMLAGLEELRELGFPVLAGTSRKGFLTAGLAAGDVDGLAIATTASNVAAVLAGAHVLRVHDVAPARAASSIADAILREDAQGVGLWG